MANKKAKEQIDVVETIQELKRELEAGDTKRTQPFLDLVLSNGDVLNDLEDQLVEEGI